MAEVLSHEDKLAIESCFGVSVQQVYQCNEGMFGQTCSHGNFHLNEDGLIVEKEWLDDTRFQPIITDMRRTVQPVVRYKMNDILHATTCQCGSKMVAVSQIEGRTDDVLQFADGKSIFPDFIRRTITGAHRNVTNQMKARPLPYVSPESIGTPCSSLDTAFRAKHPRHQVKPGCHVQIFANSCSTSLNLA